MKVVRGQPSTWASDGVEHALAIGVFDGVHRGHRAVLGMLRDRAGSARLDPAVLTFDPHPLAFVAPERAPAMLTGIDHRLELLAGEGITLTAVLPFDSATRGLEPVDFLGAVVTALGARVLVVGEDFRFGRDRLGDASLLANLGPELSYEAVVVPLVGDDRPVSSTRIREMVATGDVAGAREALERPHELWGEVVRGDGRGRSIGVPTANLAISAGMALPKDGVYAATAGRSGSEAIPAVANIGTRPTFDGEEVTVEAHLLDFAEDLYGEVLRLRFIERIRDEQRFESPEALVGQIHRDIETAKRVL